MPSENDKSPFGDNHVQERVSPDLKSLKNDGVRTVKLETKENSCTTPCVKVEESCYSLSQEYKCSPAIDTSCYELFPQSSTPVESNYSMHADRIHEKNNISSSTLNLKSHKRKLSDLRSSTESDFNFLEGSTVKTEKNFKKKLKESLTVLKDNSFGDSSAISTSKRKANSSRDSLGLKSIEGYSSCDDGPPDNDFLLGNESTQERKISLKEKHGQPSTPSRPNAWRKSLPPLLSSQDKLSMALPKRKSFPLTHLANSSPPFNSFRRCATDQTPFQVDSFRQRKRPRPSLPRYDASSLRSLKSESGFIDSHCHLDFLFSRQWYTGTYAEYQDEHKDTYPRCYKGCIAVFCNPFTFHKTYMWGKFLEEKKVWASFGCHPHNAKDYDDRTEKALYAALRHSKVRALGEIGLDYSNRNNCIKEVQHKVFRRQLKIAVEMKLPVIIHCREAHDDGMRIIKEILPAEYVIHLHCFTDTWERARAWLDAFPNLFIGITNVVTFPSAENVHEVARNIPLQRLLLETDAPYFVPRMVNKSSQVSHPGMAIHVAAQIAAIKNTDLEEVLHWTRRNTKRVYNV